MPVLIWLILCLWLGAVPVQAQAGPPQRRDLGRLNTSENFILQKIVS